MARQRAGQILEILHDKEGFELVPEHGYVSGECIGQLMGRPGSGSPVLEQRLRGRNGDAWFARSRRPEDSSAVRSESRSREDGLWTLFKPSAVPTPYCKSAVGDDP